VTATLAYVCRFPSGPRQAQVTVTASLPGTAQPGQPVQPAGAQLTIAFPQAVAPDLARLHSGTVSAATRLSVGATDGPDGISVLWPGVTRRAARVPARGRLVLRTSGRAPALTPALPGDLTLTAAGLFLMLTPGSAHAPGPTPAPASAGGADQGATPAPAATSTAPAAPTQPALPSVIGVSCALANGQQATLATVPVTGAPARTPQRSTAAVTPQCPKLPPGGLQLNPRFPLPPHPPGSKVGSAPAQACAYTTGYADVSKLNGAALIQPVLTNVDLTVRTVTNFGNANYIEFDNAAQLDYHGKQEFPPSTATFLTFGFVPTTATIQLIEHGTVNIIAVGPAIPGATCHPTPYRTCDNIATVYSRLSVQIVPGSVTVNGTPLNVGSQCQTPPFDAILTGSSATTPPYSVQNGGPLLGFVTIPPFKNCGVGENLDPLFNSAISGPRNFNLLTQGAVCFVIGAFGCDPNTGLPAIPTPLRKVIG
jgi:hypothetical protein